jgi:predicted GTPase
VPARWRRADTERPILVDPRPHARGSIARTFEAYPERGAVLPAGFRAGASSVNAVPNSLARYPFAVEVRKLRLLRIR